MFLKVTKKLAGESAGTAAWATNVGNEHGQILISVLTETEGEGLQAMTQGLVKRYHAAQETPPSLVYVDRDCYSGTGISKVKQMLEPWDIQVCLDVWHFMRRFSLGCTSDAHPLYGTFMSRLSTQRSSSGTKRT